MKKYSGKSKIALFPRYSARDEWKSADGELASAFLRYGETLRGKPEKWRELTPQLYREFAENGNRSRYEDLYFERRFDLIDLVICECLEGEGNYLDDIACALTKICNELSWCLPAHNPSINAPDLGADSPAIDLFAADTAATISCVLYLVGEELSKTHPISAEAAERELSLRVKKPYLERDFDWTLKSGKMTPCNWSSWISANILLSFALTEDDESTLYKCVSSSSETVKKLYDYLPDDGECDEGVGYWNVSPLAIYNFVEIMRAVTGANQPLPEKLKRFAAYPHSMHISDGRYFNFGDCKLTPALDYPSAYRFALEAGNCAAAECYRTLINRGAYFYCGNSTEMTAYRAVSALFTRYDGGEGAAVKHENAYYEAGKLLTVHAGKYSAAVKGGVGGGHSHIDAGNYIVYKENRPVAIDVGNARYTRESFSAARGSLWYVSPDYHNLPAVNGIEQHGHGGCEVLAHEVGHDGGLLVLDMTDAYEGARLGSYIRRVTATHGGVEVQDGMSFLSCGNNRADFRIMTAVRPVTDNGVIRIGNSSVHVKATESYEVDTDVIELNDDLLRSQWGSEIYRVKISVFTYKDSLEFAVTFI